MQGLPLKPALQRRWGFGALALVLVGCHQAPADPPAATGRTVALVNGAAIGEADLELALRSKGHVTEAPSPERRAAALDALVRDELRRQRALELGLLPSPALADELTRATAQLEAVRRRALSEALLTQQAAIVTDPEVEARRFFDANQALVRTEAQVWQLLLRDEAKLQQLLVELRAGTPFEEVARRQFGDLPESAGRPWELGFLGFQQLPPQWRPALQSLAPGEVSDIIHGPAGRVWVIKLIARRQNDALTFEQVRPTILEELKHGQLDAAATSLDRELRSRATVTLSPP